MSHELRTPLNAIGGYAELIEMGIHGPVTPEQRSALDRIQRSQQALLSVINEVLNYARLETGAVTYDLADVPVAEVVSAAETATSCSRCSSTCLRTRSSSRAAWAATSGRRAPLGRGACSRSRCPGA
jgi:signal transduction histidine kinase